MSCRSSSGAARTAIVATRSGPFSLETYEQARKRASDIAAVAGDRSMPPWKPVAGAGPKLKHDPSLTAAEVAMLDAWAEAGAPRARRRTAPPVRKFAEGWALGTPDLVLEMGEDFTVPATGPDLYRCFVIPTNLRRDASISAVEYQPGNRRVVHHVMAFLDTTGAGRERDAADPGPGYTSYSGAGVEVEGDLGGWAAGNIAHHLPDGIGRPLPAFSDVILQVHYHPSGKPEIDRIAAGDLLLQEARPADAPLGQRHQRHVPAPPRASPTSRSRPPGTSPSTSRRSASPPTCTSSAATSG